MEPMVKVQEEEERVPEHQEARVWATWNSHGYPEVQDLEDDLLYCYGTHAHLCQNKSKREYLTVCLSLAYSLRMS